MQSSIDPISSDKGVQADFKKVVILCAAGVRSVVFWPSHNTLVIHEYGNQRKVELGYSASRILEILINRADAIVSREEIFAFAWPDRIVGQNSLNQAISTIRELLSDEEQRAIIQTVPRRGYQFNSEFLVPSAQADEDGAAASINAPLEPSRQAPRILASWSALWWSRKSILLGVIFALVVSLFLRVDWNLWLQPELVKKIETQGLLTVLYAGASVQEVETLQGSMTTLRDRMVNLLDAPGTVIFNTMHSFYEIVCISGSTVEFVSVHKSKLATLTDEQLERCLK